MLKLFVSGVEGVSGEGGRDIRESGEADTDVGRVPDTAAAAAAAAAMATAVPLLSGGWRLAVDGCLGRVGGDSCGFTMVMGVEDIKGAEPS